MANVMYKYHDKNEVKITGRLWCDPTVTVELDRKDMVYDKAVFTVANNVIIDNRRTLNKIVCEASGAMATKIGAKIFKGYEVLIFGKLRIDESNKARIIVSECYLVSIPKSALEAEEDE